MKAPAKVGAGKPRILLYDLETSPNIAYIWEKYEQDALGDFIKERQIIAFAWKWLDEKEVHALSMPMFPDYKENPDDNTALVERLHAILSSADIAIGHNIVQFDDRMANADMIKKGMRPPTPHKTVDTLQFARTKFRFNSNKLDDLGKLLGCGRKVKHEGFGLWAKCLRGDMDAWAKMVQYCKQDVILLEQIYLRLRPWMTNHPNVNALDGNDGCPVCRSKNLISRGFSILIGGKRPRFQCKDCGKWSSGVVKNGKWEFRSKA